LTFLDRFIGAILAIFCIAVAAAAFVVAVGWDAAPHAAELVATMRARAWETGLSAIVLLMAGAHLLSCVLPHRSDKAIVRSTSLGQVRVSLRAVEQVVFRGVNQIRGVRDIEVRVRPTAAGVDVWVAIAVAPDLVIPDLAHDVQQRVERSVQETVGVPVGAVVAEVRAVTGESRVRVE
jgi:uncharacterized alkaline shock family protein YloU